MRLRCTHWSADVKSVPPIVTVPLKVALPFVAKIILFPILIPLASIPMNWVLPSFNSKPEPDILICSVAVLPIVVVAPKFATCALFW